MSGKQVKAIGFAGGIERLMILSKNNILSQRLITIIYISQNEKNVAFETAIKLRKSGFLVDFIYDGNFKKQLKKATQNNSQFVVIIGEEEVKNCEVVVKDFDNSKEQKVKQDLLIHYLSGKI
jgi:histidyl-tRNA synthetase